MVIITQKGRVRSKPTHTLWHNRVWCDVFWTQRAPYLLWYQKECAHTGCVLGYIFWAITICTLCWTWHTPDWPNLYIVQYVTNFTLNAVLYIIYAISPYHFSIIAIAMSYSYQKIFISLVFFSRSFFISLEFLNSTVFLKKNSHFWTPLFCLARGRVPIVLRPMFLPTCFVKPSYEGNPHGCPTM